MENNQEQFKENLTTTFITKESPEVFPSCQRRGKLGGFY